MRTLAKRSCILACKAIALAVLPFLLPHPVSGQDDDSIETLYNKSIAAMNAANWEEGLKLTDQIIANFGEFALADYGPMFGGIYYNKGFCEMKLKAYEKASLSFKTSAEQFYNKKPEDPRGDVADSINPYEKRSVFQWALCEQLSQNYEEALKLYEKYLALKPPAEELEPGNYFINLAICQSNIGRMDDAMVSLKRVFDNQVKYRVQTPALLQGFYHLGSAWVKNGADNPQVIDAAHTFLDQYLPQLQLRPWEMQRYNPLVVQLAQQAGQAKFFDLSLRIYGLYAGVEDAIEDLYDRAVDYGGVTEKLQAEIDKLQAMIDGGDPLDLNVLRGIAACYDGMGDIEGYYIVYRHLEGKYKESKDRPAILFGAARGAAGVGDVEGTQRYGMEFIEKFTDHELYDQVSSLMIGTLFQERQYEKCIEIAKDVQGTLEEGSKARDIVEFILAGSYHYLGQFKEAQPVLDGHVENYAQSQHVVNSRYFQASNRMKLDEYDVAAELFDKYIEEFPQSPLLDVALYERAMCEYILQDENFDRALELIERIDKEFPESTVLDSALVLRGDVQRAVEAYEDSEKAYAKAKDVAEKLGHAGEAANALSKLVDVLVVGEKWEETAAAYDEFFAKYPEAPQRASVAVVGMDALTKLDRTSEGLDRLETVILAISKEENQEGLERAINSYVSISSDEVGVDATIVRLEAFPGLRESKALSAWVLVSKVELLQGQLEAMKEDDPLRPKRAADVKKVFDQLREYDRSELSGYIVLAVGKYIGKTDNPFLAIDWFEEVLARDNQELHPFALIQLGNIEAQSKDPEELARAEARFRKIIDVYQTPELMQAAALGLMDLYYNKEDWEKLLDVALGFQENRNFKTGRPKANFMIARAYEGKGELGRAQQGYVNVWFLYKQYVEWSARAWLRNAEIEWNKGNDEAKMRAYEMLRELEKKIGHLSDEDKSGWIRKALRRLDEIREAQGITPEVEKQMEDEKANAKANPAAQ